MAFNAKDKKNHFTTILKIIIRKMVDRNKKENKKKKLTELEKHKIYCQTVVPTSNSSDRKLEVFIK